MGAADGSIFARHTVSAGGFDVSYLKGGADGDLDPVLYLHGMGGAGKWEAFHMALGTTTMTYVPQLPGWREGKVPEGISSVEDYARVVVDLIDALDLERVAGQPFVVHPVGRGGGEGVAAARLAELSSHCGQRQDRRHR